MVTTTTYGDNDCLRDCELKIDDIESNDNVWLREIAKVNIKRTDGQGSSSRRPQSLQARPFELSLRLQRDLLIKIYEFTSFRDISRHLPGAQDTLARKYVRQLTTSDENGLKGTVEPLCVNGVNKHWVNA